MNQDPSVELTLELERSLEELEEKVAPMLAANHNETFVVDSALLQRRSYKV
jgi:hypothetical protein